MDVCLECGATEQGYKELDNDNEHYKICNICGAEDSIQSYNEDEGDR